MWNRQTPAAKEAFHHAQREAEALHSSQLETQHLLLGILREEYAGVAWVLGKAGLTLQQVRQHVLAHAPRGHGEVTLKGCSEHAKRALELMADDAGRMERYDAIDCEHLLVGLIREKNGLASKLLRGLGLETARIRELILDYYDLAPPEVSEPGDEFQWEIFGEEARQVVWGAQQEATKNKFKGVEPEFILLSLSHQTDYAGARVLCRLGVSEETVHVVVQQLLQRQIRLPGGSPDAPGINISGLIKALRMGLALLDLINLWVFKQPIPLPKQTKLTPATQEVLQQASLEAGLSWSRWVGSDHLLLALFAWDAKRENILLNRLGLSYEQVGDEVQEYRVEKFGVRAAQAAEWPRLTARAHKAMELARQEAVNSGEAFTHPRHILRGIFRENEALGAQILHGLGIRSEDILNDRFPSKSNAEAIAAEWQGLSPPSQLLVESAIQEAEELKCKYAGSEHLLLALCRAETIATASLNKRGISVDDVIAEMEKLRECPD